MRDRMCICNTAQARHYKCFRQGSPPRHPASVSRSRNKLRVRSPLSFLQPDFFACEKFPARLLIVTDAKCQKHGVSKVFGGYIHGMQSDA